MYSVFTHFRLKKIISPCVLHASTRRGKSKRCRCTNSFAKEKDTENEPLLADGTDAVW